MERGLRKSKQQRIAETQPLAKWHMIQEAEFPSVEACSRVGGAQTP